MMPNISKIPNLPQGPHTPTHAVAHAELGLSRRSWLGLAGAAAAGVALSPAHASRAHTIAHTIAQPAPDTSDLQGAGFYRTRLGEFDLFLISDGAFLISDASAILASNAQPADYDAALRRAFLKPDAIMGQVNALLIRTPDAVVLIDTGCGELFGPSTGKLLPNLARAGFKPSEIDAVVLTHAHPDHHGGLLNGATAAALTNARFFASRIEHDFWTGPAPDFSRSLLPRESIDQMIQGANAAFATVKPRLDLIADKDQIAPGINAMLLGGHTPGHLGLRIASGSEELLYVSDLIINAPLGMAHPEWHVAFDLDPAEGSRVRRATLERIASDRARIAGSHLPFPALGHVRAQDRAFEFVPSSWTW
jgi:glyoxylase-like metal-dependent hydrolase (beta-lactamase superfamily II)